MQDWFSNYELSAAMIIVRILQRIAGHANSLGNTIFFLTHKGICKVPCRGKVLFDNPWGSPARQVQLRTCLIVRA